jgi:hypothetical protein
VSAAQQARRPPGPLVVARQPTRRPPGSRLVPARRWPVALVDRQAPLMCRIRQGSRVPHRVLLVVERTSTALLLETPLVPAQVWQFVQLGSPLRSTRR